MKRFLFAIISTSVFWSSCVHYYYAPNANNVPLLKEKNDVRFQAQYSSGNNFSGYDVQSAYALSNHAGVQLNFFHAAEDDGENGSGFGNYIEAAGGYYHPSHNKHWIFESYAGLGNGWVNNNYGYSEFAKTGVTKFFIQPSFGFTSKNFDMALSSKFGFVNINVKESNLSNNHNSFDLDYINFLKTSKPFYYWEPGISIRGGFRQCKVLIQVTHTFAKNSELALDDTNLSLGILIPFKITTAHQ